jgi:hypothetical protein
MNLTYDSIKKLLDNSKSVNLSDSIPLDLLIRVAETARKPEKHLTMRFKNLGIEDLKKISQAAEGNTSFYVEETQD